MKIDIDPNLELYPVSMQDNRTLFILRDVRTTYARHQATMPVDDVTAGEEFAEAIDRLDSAIIDEVLALPEPVE